MIANHENDSISLVDLVARTKIGELDLRPGKIDTADRGKPGGAYPFWVAVKGDREVYVSSQRDRQVVVVDIGDGAPRLLQRIAVGGQPNKMLLNRDQRLLFVANGNSDTVSVIDTDRHKVIEEFATTAPREVFGNREKLKGSNPNSLALTPDERFLMVSNGGTNSVAVIKLSRAARKDADRREREKDDDDDDEALGNDGSASNGDRVGRAKGRNKSHVVGLIPTGFYPNSVSTSKDGSMLYIVNGKSNAGPNPGACRNTSSIAPGSLDQCNAANQYVWQLTTAGFLSMPMPTGRELAGLANLASGQE